MPFKKRPRFLFSHRRPLFFFLLIASPRSLLIVFQYLPQKRRTRSAQEACALPAVRVCCACVPMFVPTTPLVAAYLRRGRGGCVFRPRGGPWGHRPRRRRGAAAVPPSMPSPPPKQSCLASVPVGGSLGEAPRGANTSVCLLSGCRVDGEDQIKQSWNVQHASAHTSTRMHLQAQAHARAGTCTPS